MAIKGDIKPLKEITIHAEDFVEPFHFVNDFHLDFKGESLRVVIGLVECNISLSFFFFYEMKIEQSA